MDLLSSHFLPPLLLSVPTDQITFEYVGLDAGWQSLKNARPLRSAKEGNLSIYGSHTDSASPTIIAVSFEEDDLPALNRQVYYHYLEREDAISISNEQVTFIINNLPADSDKKKPQSKDTLSWSINLESRVLKTVRPVLTQVRFSKKNPSISTRPADERALFYYNLRSSLTEQPIPERLGTIGHSKKKGEKLDDWTVC